MRRGTARALVALVAIGGCGCALAQRVANFETSAEADDARTIVGALARHDFGAIKGRMADPLLTPDLDAQLGQLSAFFPPTPPTRRRIVGFQGNTTTVVGGHKTENVDVMVESNYEAANVVTEIVFQRVDDGARKVIGLHAQPLAAPLEVLNAFTFRGKGALHFGFLVAMLASAVVTLAALVVWARAGRAVHRRWWWLLGIVLGAFRVTLDWTTGAVAIQAVTVQFFSVGFSRPGLDGPVFLMVSLPVGAIAFLIVRRQVKTRPVEPPPPVDGPPPVSS